MVDETVVTRHAIMVITCGGAEAIFYYVFGPSSLDSKQGCYEHFETELGYRVGVLSVILKLCL